MIIFKKWNITRKGLYKLVGEVQSPQAKKLFLLAEDSQTVLDKYNFLEHLSKSWTAWEPNKRYMFTLDGIRLYCWEKII